jgi:hypothetical protein
MHFVAGLGAGWALSHRMWTREEILLMCVILVDPALYFDDIRQKNRGRSGEAFQNRGMAALDDRVQAIMQARLSAYIGIKTQIRTFQERKLFDTVIW